MNNYLPCDGEVLLLKDFIRNETAVTLLQKLINDVTWRSDTIRMFGKVMEVPRLTAFYGDNGIQYKYSGLLMDAEPWPVYMEAIKKLVESIVNHRFNAVLVNYYRNGNDYVSWHADNEKELGNQPVIAMVSLGAERILQFRHLYEKDKKVDIAIPGGSLLLMQGTTQHYWQHQLKKQPAIKAPRISLTFRRVI